MTAMKQSFTALLLCFQSSLLILPCNGFQTTRIIQHHHTARFRHSNVVLGYGIKDPPRSQHHPLLQLYSTHLDDQETVFTAVSVSNSTITNNEATTIDTTPVLQTEGMEDNALILEQATAYEEERERMKNIMLFLCWGVALLSALDRVAMSVAMVPMSAEFGYTDTMKGSVSSLFSVGYGLGIVPAGIVVATASPRIVMAVGITVWSLATIATPFATAYTGMMPLLLARVCVGAAESVVLPTLQTLLSSWTTTEQKSRSLATVFSGFHTGTIGAYLISPLIIEYFDGWRNLFVLYGAVGMFWLIPWLLLSKDSPANMARAENEKQYTKLSTGVVVDVTPASEATISSNNGNEWMAEFGKSVETLKAAPWGDFVKSKGVWAMLLAHCANNVGLYNNLNWSPTFYSEQYGLNVRDSALFSVLPSIAGAIGGLVAGSLSDSILKDINEEEDEAKRVEATTNVRKAFQGLALFGPSIALFTLASHIPEQPWVAQLLLMGTTGLQAFNAAGYLSANQEKAGEKWAGLLYSITSLPAVMIGTTGVFLTGRILDLTQQDWSIVFALNAGINVLGAAAFVALYDSKQEFD